MREEPPGVLRNSAFRNLLLAATSTSFGSQVAVLTMPTIAILAAHASAAQVGALFAVGYLGPPLFGLAGGVFVERRSRKGVMAFTALIRVAAVGSVPLVWAVWQTSIDQLYVVAFIVSVSGTLYDVAAQSTLPAIVDRGELPDANSKLAVGRSGSQIAGPSIAGILIQAIGAPATLAADAVAHFGGAIFVSRLPGDAEKRQQGTSFRRDTIDGVSFVWRQKPLRHVAGATAVLNLGGASIAAIFYVFAYRTLHLSPLIAGAVASMGNVGLLLGAVGTVRIIRRLGSWQVIRLGLAGAALSIWLIPLARAGLPWLVLAVYELLFASLSVAFAIAQLSWRQALTPTAFQARTHAIVRSISVSTLPVGALLGGIAASRLGVMAAIFIGAAIGTAGAGWLLLCHPSDLDRPEAQWT